MRLLCFSDVHDTAEYIGQLRVKSKQSDVLVCAGDLSVFGQRLGYLLGVIDGFGKPWYMVAGNHESCDDLKYYQQHLSGLCVLHNEHIILGGHLVIGHGGGGFSARAVDFSGAVFVERVASHRSASSGKVIFVTHQPPYGSGVDALYGRLTGNRDYAHFIEHSSPDLVVCGHIHEHAGRKIMRGSSLVCNPGPQGEVIVL